MHGFVLFAIAFALRGEFIFATISMVLAVNFKQTALYFALPFVIYTFSQLQIRHHNANIAKEIDVVMNRCLFLGVIFTVTNFLLWLPWLITDDLKFSLEGAKEVFNRIFPVRRGIFEDKVASFWCVLHYLTPLRPHNWYDNSFNFKLTMGTTFFSCIPSCYLLYKAPSAKQFLCCLFCISMLFFIFGF